MRVNENDLVARPRQDPVDGIGGCIKRDRRFERDGRLSTLRRELAELRAGLLADPEAWKVRELVTERCVLALGVLVRYSFRRGSIRLRRLL